MTITNTDLLKHPSARHQIATQHEREAMKIYRKSVHGDRSTFLYALGGLLKPARLVRKLT